MLRLPLALLLISACTGAPSKPLAEAIVGEWEVLCRTDSESTATCLGKEGRGMYKQFLADGRLVAGARRGISMDGTWKLTDNELELTLVGAGMRVTELYRARIEGDSLVLWYPAQEFGAIYGRVGAVFEPAASKQSSGPRTSYTLGDVGYSLALPAGYRLSRDDNNRQQWSPASGPGFIVDLSLSKRAQTQVDGVWVTPPCSDRDYGGIAGEGRTIDGVERDTAIGISLCISDSDAVLMCSAEHTRGHLEEAERDAALALCKSLAAPR